MGSTVRVTGVNGALRYGYHSAGVLRNWIVERADDRWTLKATVVSVDTFKVSQRPLTFVAAVKHGSWRWPITELQIEGASLDAALGPKERST